MPVLVYSLLRLALFAVTTAVLWWAGMRSWLAPLLAAFLAWGLSYVLLAGPRDAAALHLARRAAERRAGRTTGRAADDAAAEDAAVADAAVQDAAVQDAAVQDAAVQDTAVQDGPADDAAVASRSVDVPGAPDLTAPPPADLPGAPARDDAAARRDPA